VVGQVVRDVQGALLAVLADAVHLLLIERKNAAEHVGRWFDDTR
jgi:hypothetical protein